MWRVIYSSGVTVQQNHITAVESNVFTPLYMLNTIAREAKCYVLYSMTFCPIAIRGNGVP
jgi:hypothetical protein